MTKKEKERKQLLNREGHLQAYARKFYIDRFSNVTNGWGWESKIRWGLPPQQH